MEPFRIPTVATSRQFQFKARSTLYTSPLLAQTQNYLFWLVLKDRISIIEKWNWKLSGGIIPSILKGPSDPMFLMTRIKEQGRFFGAETGFTVF